MCVGTIWLFDFCEEMACVSGNRQCAKCELGIKFFFLMCGGQKIKNIGSAFWSCKYFVFLSFHNVLLSVLVLSSGFLHLAVTAEAKSWRAFWNTSLSTCDKVY
jgi:hypothetical protein